MINLSYSYKDMDTLQTALIGPWAAKARAISEWSIKHTAACISTSHGAKLSLDSIISTIVTLECHRE